MDIRRLGPDDEEAHCVMGERVPADTVLTRLSRCEIARLGRGVGRERCIVMSSRVFHDKQLSSVSNDRTSTLRYPEGDELMARWLWDH